MKTITTNIAKVSVAFGIIICLTDCQQEEVKPTMSGAFEQSAVMPSNDLTGANGMNPAQISTDKADTVYVQPVVVPFPSQPEPVKTVEPAILVRSK